MDARIQRQSGRRLFLYHFRYHHCVHHALAGYVCDASLFLAHSRPLSFSSQNAFAAVLSVVFQTYIQAMSEIHDRSMQDREDALRLAYLALEVKSKDGNHGFVKISSLTKVLRKLRPHYNEMKVGRRKIMDGGTIRWLPIPF